MWYQPLRQGRFVFRYQKERAVAMGDHCFPSGIRKCSEYLVQLVAKLCSRHIETPQPSWYHSCVRTSIEKTYVHIPKWQQRRKDNGDIPAYQNYNLVMRTTCDIDDDVMRRIQAYAADRHCTLKEAIHDLLRAGLMQPKSALKEEWTCERFDLGTARVDYAKAWQLVDTLESDAVAEKMRLRK